MKCSSSLHICRPESTHPICVCVCVCVFVCVCVCMCAFVFIHCWSLGLWRCSFNYIPLIWGMQVKLEGNPHGLSSSAKHEVFISFIFDQVFPPPPPPPPKNFSWSFFTFIEVYFQCWIMNSLRHYIYCNKIFYNI